MIIVYSCSKLYEPMCKISIESVLRHNPDAEMVLVCQEKLELPYKQITIKQNRLVKDGPITPSWEGNAKLFFTQLPYSKIIYLGADTICQGSLQEMWDYPCEYINACESNLRSRKQAKELGIGYYINVDSMVMNLDALREDDFTSKAFETQDYPVEVWCNEETMINGHFHDKIKLLPQKFNYAFDRDYEKPMKYEDATILHFISAKNKKDMFKYYEKTCNIR
jgi:lipopolysaccharide biosynthesis glycosyltransferase